MEICTLNKNNQKDISKSKMLEVSHIYCLTLKRLFFLIKEWKEYIKKLKSNIYMHLLFVL